MGKLGRIGLTNQIAMSDSNLDSYFVSQLMAYQDIANDIARRNDMIKDIANHVDIIIKIGYVFLS